MTQPSSPLLTSLNLAASTSPDGKRNLRLKESQFISKHGQRHHSYDNEKAPYPLSYDRHVLEIESLDNRLAYHLRGSVSFVNFTELPRRALDLGCGTGTWVIEAAKEWPQCNFVGFDLVKIQIPVLEPELASRIQWQHGNFLTTKLPFEDDEFDHVHIQSIAKGVPENKAKWNEPWAILMFLQEVNRVLRPEGSVEIIEDDILFPSLPRWFTSALRARPCRTPSINHPDGTKHVYSSPPRSDDTMPSHDHALLESLNRSVFEHRFINMTPTAILPSYFTTYFRQVTLGPVLNFPMPPLPPMRPLSPQLVTAYAISSLDVLDTHSWSNPSSSSPPHSKRPASLSFSSSVSTTTNSTTASSNGPSLLSNRPRTASASWGSPLSSLVSQTSPSSPPKAPLNSPVKPFTLDRSSDGYDYIASSQPLFAMERLMTLSERSLAMHLYRSYQSVLACQEAMWEELMDRVWNRKEELVPFGWDDDEELEELQSRKKFEKLMERFQSDMQARLSFWCSLTDIGWLLPTREPLSKAEVIEEERIRESMLEARQFASEEDLQTVCRSLRVLVGYKL
ncbi:hypothetical protein K443DRAFT_87444 [Laccaria amethystina LaAM-08-1]|uniref:Methyltransferase domain-containing protein n=1 Tax=Laccaria amethystina LaAM-08-1 TaxID=1095629 RepID=A0A0C9YAC6_9AGAR|nr:hypothetical protein K443DRAFT_87444 [Laccaria amethystina LaAM-08-1]